MIDQEWSKLRDKPDKLISKVRKECREKKIPLSECQNGTSHWKGSTDRGIVIIPRHGEIAKGTFASIMRTLVGLGIAGLLFMYWMGMI